MLDVLWEMDLYEAKTLSPHKCADRCESDSPEDLWICPATGRRRGGAVMVPIDEPFSDEADEWEDESNHRSPYFKG